MIKYLPAFLILFSACVSEPEETFLSFMGEEKSRIIKQADKSYSKFLKDNFDGSDDFERTLNFLTFLDTTITYENNWKIDLDEAKSIISQYESSGLRKDFILIGYENYEYDYLPGYNAEENSTSDTKSLDTLVLELETKTLSQEFWHNAHTKEAAKRIAEIEQMEQQRDSSAHNFNTYGRYIYGLSEYYSRDSTVCGYVEAIQAVSGHISPSIIANGLKMELERKGEITDGTRIIILFEFYLPILEHQINRP